MWANSSGVRLWPAISRSFMSFQDGSMLLKTAGSAPSPYQPMPNPWPLVVVAPMRECRLWSMIECTGRNSRSSAKIGSPEYAIHLHMRRVKHRDALTGSLTSDETRGFADRGLERIRAPRGVGDVSS